jgi:hypothetical protein
LWPLSEQQTDWRGNLAEKGLPKAEMVAGFRQKISRNPPIFITSCCTPKAITYHLFFCNIGRFPANNIFRTTFCIPLTLQKLAGQLDCSAKNASNQSYVTFFSVTKKLGEKAIFQNSLQ